MDNALALADQLDPANCRVKVGKELYTREGPGILKALHDRQFDVFLDLKFHDIPNTVARACSVAADLGVWMMNVHALGGSRMMEAAQKAVEQEGGESLLIAVTVLTSMEASDLRGVGIDAEPREQVLRLARLAQEAGLAGIVCSAREAPELRAELGQAFKLVTPGIRPADAEADDQSRIVTPEQAMAYGVDYLVIGRPVTQAISPKQALDRILSSLPA